MSFFSSLKRSLGFGGDDDTDDESLYADDTDAQEPATDSAPAPDAPVEISADARLRIFDRVVEVFNASLPDFLARSVDPAAQRQYLLGALDQDLRTYLNGLAEAADAHCRREWESRQATLTAELDSVRAKSAEIERQSADTKQKQLSADRQKRALADRVHDLEATLGKLEAEREQYELENRSLVNRLKVAGVQQDDAEAARAEAERLKAEIERLKQQPASAADPDETEALRRQVSEMSEGIDALKEQQRMSTEMLKDERKRLADTTAELTATKDALTDASAELAAARQELDDCRNRLNEANSLLDGFNELQHRMEEVDRAISSRDAKIKRQQQQLAERDKELKQLRDRVAAEPVSDYTTTAPKSADTDITPEESPAPRISESELSAMEQTFESEEWFTNTPPAQTPSMRPPEDESDFGYHPPRRRSNPPVHPDQLSLF